MILVTGATGFIGRRLVRRLTNLSGSNVRVLLQPGSEITRLPSGVPIHIMMGNLDDSDSLVAAMDGVHTIYHLVGTETRGRHVQLDEIDIAGTRAMLEAALAARVGRFMYVSRIGADRSSAFSVLRAKGEIEDAIRKSGLAYTIFRAGVLFGQHDRFSEHIAMLARSFPLYFVPGEGDQNLHPLWVEDLVTCLTMAQQSIDLIDDTIELGGPEILSYRRIVMRVMYAIGSQRPILSLPLLVMRVGAWFLDGLFARWPFTEHWIELLSSSPTAELGNIERMFDFRPAMFDIGLIDKYMTDRHYTREMLKYIFTQQW